MSTWVAFDTATVTGVACKGIHSGKFLCCNVRPENFQELEKVIHQAKDNGCTHALLEDPYLKKFTYRDKRGITRTSDTTFTLLALQRVTSFVEYACLRNGLIVERVKANTWQSYFAITGPRESRKQQAMVIARKLGATPENFDQADACLMLEWIIRQKKFEERVR